MAEYIEREAAIDTVGKWLFSVFGMKETDRAATVFKKLRSIPAADVLPVVRGRWENNHCSACGMMPMGEEIWECCDFAPPKFEWFMNFCPNCGADMREER